MKQVVRQVIYYNDGTSATLNVGTASPLRFYRVKHDIEYRGVWRAGLPEVQRLIDQHHSPFQRWAQELSYGLNPWFKLRKDLWRKMYDYKYAWANNQGFRIPEDPRADFINMFDITKDLPRVEALLGGGSLCVGEKKGDWTIVKGLHFNAPVTLEYALAHPEYWVRGIAASGTGQPYRMLGDKYPGPAFIHPLIINKEKGDLRIESIKLQEWTSSTPPDPLKIYL
jgi:hypothetical protein